MLRAVGRSALPAEAPAAQKNGRLVADRWTLATDHDGVFAGGDVVLGPATVVEAIGQGRRAAEAIERYLNPQSATHFPWRVPRALDTKFDPEAPASRDKRVHAPKADPHKRAHDLAEVERTIAAGPARREARRCLRCDYGKACPEPAGAPKTTTSRQERRAP